MSAEAMTWEVSGPADFREEVRSRLRQVPAAPALQAQARAWLEAMEGAFREAGGEPGAGVGAAAGHAAVRDRALAALAQWPVPHRRLERWKYTPIGALLEQRFTLAPQPLPVDRAVACPAWSGYRVVIVNGRWVPAWSRLPEGVVVEMGASDGWDQQDWMGAVLTRYAQEGMVLRVEAGVALDAPILVESVVHGVQVACFPNHRMELGAGAQATVVEWSHSTPETTGFCGTGWTLSLGEGAVATLQQVVNDAGTVHRQVYLAADQAAESRVQHVHFVVQASQVRADLAFRLLGEGAHTELKGAYLPCGAEKVAHYTTVDHRVPHCTSDEDYRGVLYDQATGVFNGKIFVRTDAQKTEAYQRNANLLVGREAVMYSKPELEIYADDVKCSHGCTVGQIDEKALFYARSRGISEEAARALLVEAFVAEALEVLPGEGVRDAVRAALAARHGGFGLEDEWNDWTA